MSDRAEVAQGCHLHNRPVGQFDLQVIECFFKADNRLDRLRFLAGKLIDQVGSYKIHFSGSILATFLFSLFTGLQGNWFGKKKLSIFRFQSDLILLPLVSIQCKGIIPALDGIGLAQVIVAYPLKVKEVGCAIVGKGNNKSVDQGENNENKYRGHARKDIAVVVGPFTDKDINADRDHGQGQESKNGLATGIHQDNCIAV